MPKLRTRTKPSGASMTIQIKRGSDGLIKAGGRGGVGDDAGERKAAGHVTVHALHMGAQPCIDLGADPLRRVHPAGRSPSVGIVITHGSLLYGWFGVSERGIVG